MGRKYMIFRAELTEEEGADNRLLTHTGAYTENWGKSLAKDLFVYQEFLKNTSTI
jgi:hypothetical protein